MNRKEGCNGKFSAKDSDGSDFEFGFDLEEENGGENDGESGGGGSSGGGGVIERGGGGGGGQRGKNGGGRGGSRGGGCARSRSRCRSVGRGNKGSSGGGFGGGGSGGCGGRAGGGGQGEDGGGGGGGGKAGGDQNGKSEGSTIFGLILGIMHITWFYYKMFAGIVTLLFGVATLGVGIFCIVSWARCFLSEMIGPIADGGGDDDVVGSDGGGGLASRVFPSWLASTPPDVHPFEKREDSGVAVTPTSDTGNNLSEGFFGDACSMTDTERYLRELIQEAAEFVATTNNPLVMLLLITYGMSVCSIVQRFFEYVREMRLEV